MGKSPFCALGIESPKSLTDTRCCLLSICIDGAVKCTGAQLQTHTHRHPQGFDLAVKHVTVRMFTARMLHVFASVTSPGIFVHFTHMHRPFGSRCQDLPAHGWPFMCIHARQGSCHNEANRIYGTQVQLPVRVTWSMVCIGVRSRPQPNRVRKLAADAHQCVPHIRCRQGHLVRMCHGNLHICED